MFMLVHSPLKVISYTGIKSPRSICCDINIYCFITWRFRSSLASLLNGHSDNDTIVGHSEQPQETKHVLSAAERSRMKSRDTTGRLIPTDVHQLHVAF